MTLPPAEVHAHADVIFVGEVEQTWPQFLKEFEQGQYVSRYAADTLPSLADAPSAVVAFHDRFVVDVAP